MNRWLLEAWTDLAAARPYAAGGMGPPVAMPMPYAAIDDHASRIGCGPDDRATLHQVIRALDQGWLKMERERMAREAQRHQAARER